MSFFSIFTDDRFFCHYYPVSEDCFSNNDHHFPSTFKNFGHRKLKFGHKEAKKFQAKVPDEALRREKLL